MWKIAVAFVVFAALAMFIIVKGGDSLNMAGEQHGGETSSGSHAPAPAGAASGAAAPAK